MITQQHKAKLAKLAIIDLFINPHKRIDKQIAQHTFTIINSNQSLHSTFIKYLPSFLTSNKPHISQFLSIIINSDQYDQIIAKFLNSIFSGNQTITTLLEQYIIGNLWKPPMTRIVNNQFKIVDIINYLSMKMRSLKSNVRKYALNSFYHYAQRLVESNHSQQVRKLIPSMIQKEVLVKKVSYTKGIFLQMLQDQLQQIRCKCIQCLGLLWKYFDSNQLKSIILYMVNDEHEFVREKALQTILTIPGFYLFKEQLETLFMCLKQNNIKLRNLVYQTILHCKILQELDFMVTINRLLDNLLTHKSDKKKIYSIFKNLASKYSAIILRQIPNLLPHQDEPSWKNIQHKAKIILIANIDQNKWPNTLPSYFTTHYLYIKDVQPQSFQVKLLNNLPSTQIALSTLSKIKKFIQSEIKLSDGFKLNLLQIINDFIHEKQTKIQLLNNIEKLPFVYNLQTSQKAQQLLKDTKMLIEIEENILRQLLLKIKNIQLNVPKNIFKVSKYDSKVLMVSRVDKFIEKCYLKHSEPKKKTYYIHLSQMQPFSMDKDYCYYQINTNPHYLECLTNYK